jgi:hypothetical protein
MSKLIPPDPPNELEVVGEHSEDPDQLLLKGSDGNFYAYEISDAEPRPVEVDDKWQFEEPKDVPET